MDQLEPKVYKSGTAVVEIGPAAWKATDRTRSRF